MPRLTIYLDDQTAHDLDRAAQAAGMSRPAWVRQALEERLRARLPESWFELLGTREDERTPDEILRDIRGGPGQRERLPLT